MNGIGAEHSLLRFACRFPIKGFGATTPPFAAHVAALVRRPTGALSDRAVQVRASGRGHFLAGTITVEATDRALLDAIRRDLSADDQVSLVL